ncbi:MarR family transcriptional regulator [Devosia sp. Leaf420]|nr:MarR family transcriptional regulator [Devosia sp. Leaf420]
MPSRDPDVRKLALTIFAANSQLLHAGNQLVAHLGLSSAWWQVLTALRASEAPLTTAGLSRKMGLSRQAVQRIVDLLELHDLVKLQPNARHQRAKLVVLTEAGFAAVGRAERAVGPIDKVIADRLGAERIRNAINTLEELNDVIAGNLAAEVEKLSKKG